MARRAFYSFHFKPDNWRAAQIRSMGIIEGNKPASDNAWEAVKRGGAAAIKAWIDGQLLGKSCSIILIGSETAGRKWIDYEIKKSWNDGKGVLGIYIHNLKDSNGFKTSKGSNPFKYFTMPRDAKKLSEVVKAYDPPYTNSKSTYNYIYNNLEDWIEQAIQIRNKY